MWLETVILRKAERRLVRYREQIKSLDKSIHEQYQAQLPEITQLYQRASHWHGTGRFQYDRYSDSVEDSSVVDVLDAILSQDGLEPKRDPWIDSGGDTVSLATVRMHGRIYARVHQSDDVSLRYELGTVVFWSRLYFTLLFIWLCSSPWVHRIVIYKLFRPASLRSIQNRVGTTRKPRNKRGFSMLEFIQGKHLGSDIQGNYPVLFSVSPDVGKLIETIPLTNKVEQRSLEPIRFDMFTHVEVPLEKVTETETLLQKHRIELSVIALEFGDMYLADRPLRELVFTNNV